MFGRLDYRTQHAIGEGMISSEFARLLALGHTMEVDDGPVEFLVREVITRTSRYTANAANRGAILSGCDCGQPSRR